MCFLMVHGLICFITNIILMIQNPGDYYWLTLYQYILIVLAVSGILMIINNIYSRYA